jgi:hypothetical protein
MKFSKKDFLEAIETICTAAPSIVAKSALSGIYASKGAAEKSLISTLGLGKEFLSEIAVLLDAEFDIKSGAGIRLQQTQDVLLDSVDCSEIWLRSFNKWKSTKGDFSTSRLFSVSENGKIVPAIDARIEWNTKIQLLLNFATTITVLMTGIQPLKAVQSDDETWKALNLHIYDAINASNVESLKKSHANAVALIAKHGPAPNSTNNARKPV